MVQATLFLSYSRRDKRTVDAIVAALDNRSNGTTANQSRFRVLQDKSEHRPEEEQRLKGIHAFEDWWLRLQRMIESADVIVFCLSPSSVESEVCEREIRHAAALNKKFAPILLEDTPSVDIPPELSRLDWVEFTDKNRFEDAIDRLINGIVIDVDWIREQTKFGDLALEWERSERASKLLLRGIRLDTAEEWRDRRPPSAPEITTLQRDFIAQSRRAASRRLRTSLTGAVVVLALLTGLAVGLWIFLEEAQHQTRIADARLLTARSQVLSASYRNRLDSSLVYAAVAARRLRAEGVDASPAQQLVLQARALLTARPQLCSAAASTEARCTAVPDTATATEDIAVTPNGERSARVDEDGITIFDRENRALARVAGLKSVQRIHFSRNGEHLAVMFRPLVADRFDVAVLDGKTGALRFSLRHDGRVSAVAMHPSQPLIATASGAYWPEDKTVSVWSLKTGRELRRSILDASPVGLQFDANRSDLVIETRDGARLIWRVDPPLERAFDLRERFVVGLFPLQSPRSFFVTLSGGRACLRDLERSGSSRCTVGDAASESIGLSNYAAHLGVTTDRRLLAVVNDGAQVCIVAPLARALTRQKCHAATGDARFLAISSGADWIVGKRGAQLCRWSFDPAIGLGQELCHPVFVHLSRNAIVVNNQGTMVVDKAAKENSPIVIDLASGRAFLAREPKAADLEIARFSGSGDFLAISETTGDYTKSHVSVFSLASETVVAKLEVDARVLSMEFSRDGTMLALGTEQTQDLNIWSWRSGDPPVSLNAGLPVQAIAFSQDDAEVIAAVGPRIRPYLEIRSFPTPKNFDNSQACALMARTRLESSLDEVRTIIDVDDLDVKQFCAF